MTQELLAEELNVSRSAIAKWEANKGVPEISNISMISKKFNVSVDELVDDTKEIGKSTIKNEKEFESSEYAGNYYDIDLTGWNDGVNDVLVVHEDDDFLFYQKVERKKNVFGMIGKRYITSVKMLRQSDIEQEEIKVIDRNYFCKKHVFVELASREGLISGFFDFRNDDYRDVMIQSFVDSKVCLEFGKEIEVESISKIEEIEK